MGSDFTYDFGGRIDAVFNKGMMPDREEYSGLTIPMMHALDGMKHTTTDWRKNFKIEVCGLAFDYCVKATAIDLAKRYPHVGVILDCTRSIDQSAPGLWKTTTELEKAGVKILINTEDVS
jgi:nicotinamidase/pyrazinamidase